MRVSELRLWQRILARGIVLTLLVCLHTATITAQSGAVTAPATASDWTPPQTPWGVPDFQGIWDYRTATPLERPTEFGDKATLTPEEAAAYEKQYKADLANYDLAPSVHAKWWLDYGEELTADLRTSLITEPMNGRMPATTTKAKTAARGRSERRALTHSVEDRSFGERCISFGVPRLPGAYNNNYQIYQTPTHVAIVQEMIHDVRIIPMDGRAHLTTDIPQWHGDSRGYYEGDSLVIETKNFSGRAAFRGATSDLILKERFTRIDAETVRYEFKVDDAATWAQPWTVMFPMTKTDQPIFEYACHEGNRGLANILNNARHAEDPNYADNLSQ